MIATAREVAQQLAKRGRVRGADDDATVAEVFLQMRPARAAGLLHDGAGWDAQRIADEAGVAVTRVRADVLRARLEAADATCRPCTDQVDGLMTFAAESLAHAMECEDCTATREALRTGKGALRDFWRNDEVKPTRPWESDTERDHDDDDDDDHDDAVVITARPRTITRQGTRPRQSTRDREAQAHLTSDEDFEEIIRRDRAGGFAVMRMRGDDQAAPDPVTRPQGGRPKGPVISLPNRAPEPIAASPSPGAARRRVRLRRPQDPSVRSATPSPAFKKAHAAPLAVVVATALALTLVAAVAADSASGPTGAEVALSQDMPDKDMPAARPMAAAIRPETEPAVPALATATPTPTPTPTLVLRPIRPRTRLDQFPVVPKPPRPAPKIVARDLTPVDPTPEPAAQQPAPAPPPPAPEPEPEPAGPITPTPQIWADLAMCESTGNWAANTGNGYYGGLQFTTSSWEMVGGSGLPSDASQDEQIQRAHTLWEIQGWRAWPVCSRKLGLR